MDLVNAPDQKIPWPTASEPRLARPISLPGQRPGRLRQRSARHASGELIEINFLENGQAVLIRHAQVQQKDIGFELAQHLNAIIPIGGFAHNGDFIIAVEELAQTSRKMA